MPTKKPNILMIAIDSLLADHMSCYGYHRLTTPHIDAFARSGTLFENTFSPHVPTTSAYSSMLSGKDCFGTNCVALRHKGPLAEGLETLPEVLEKQGYETTCIGFPGNPANRGFQNYIKYESWGQPGEFSARKAESLNEACFPALDQLASGDKPFLLFLRHMDPHSPYHPPTPYDRLFYQGDPFDPSNTSMEPVFSFKPFSDYFASWMPEGVTDKDLVIAQYDGAIAYMDACIQQIFERLDHLGILDDTIIVLNSDHGETLYDHECWFDHHGIYDVTLKVPLIIRYPAKVPVGNRISGYNQHKDLMPTLLELAEIDTGIDFDGESLMKLVRGEKRSFETEIYITECTWMRKHGWRTPEWKLIIALEPDFHFKPEEELYNLVHDPGENKNLAGELPGVVDFLRARMNAHIARREKETGRPNPVQNQPEWHGKPGIDYFTSSQQAYDSLHIGSKKEAKKLQAKDEKDN